MRTDHIFCLLLYINYYTFFLFKKVYVDRGLGDVDQVSGHFRGADAALYSDHHRADFCFQECRVPQRIHNPLLENGTMKRLFLICLLTALLTLCGCGSNQTEEHALERLEAYGCYVRRTDLEGTIVFKG